MAAIVLLIIGVQQQTQAQKMIGQATADDLIKIVETNPYNLKLAPNSMPGEITKLLSECLISDAAKAFEEYKNKSGINKLEKLFWDYLFYRKAEEIVYEKSCWEKQAPQTNFGKPVVAISQTMESDTSVHGDSSETAVMSAVLDMAQNNADSNKAAVAATILDTITTSNVGVVVQFLGKEIMNVFTIQSEAQLRFMLEMLSVEILDFKPAMDLALKLSSKSENRGFWYAAIADFYNNKEDFLKACENKSKAIQAGYSGGEIDLSRTKCN